MNKEVQLAEIIEEEDSARIIWRGYVPEIYLFLESRDVYVKIDKGKGNTAIVQRNELQGLCKIFAEKEFLISEEILSLLKDSEKVVMSETRIEPYPYQVADAMRMAAEKRLILANEMGMGKSLTALLALEGVEGLILVICPSSLLYNWKYEILRLHSDAKVVIYGEGIIEEKTKFVILSYGKAVKRIEEIIRLRARALICDEAHQLKAITAGKPGSQRARAILELSKQPIEYVFMLTGTPSSGKTKDLYNLLRCIRADDITYNGDFWKFALRYCNAHKEYIGQKCVWNVDGSSNLKELNMKLKEVMIRRIRKDIFPDLLKQRQVIPVDIVVRKEMIPDRQRFIETLMEARRAIAIAKIPFSIDLAQNIIDQGQKVVIFSSFLDVIDSISAKIKKSVVIKGSMNPEERSEAVNKFNRGEAVAIVISIECGGNGLNLQTASRVIINDLSYLPSTLAQAEDRVCRIGQTETCLIYYIVARNSVVDKMASTILDRKLRVMTETTDSGKDITNELLSTLIERGELVD